MFKKIFAILGILLLLIVSAGSIYADDGATGDAVADNLNEVNVTVKFSLENGDTSARPDSILVKFLIDGVVDATDNVSQSNNWTCTFKTPESDAEIDIDIPDINNYSKEVNVSDDGFVVNYVYEGNQVPDDNAGNDYDDVEPNYDDLNNTEDDSKAIDETQDTASSEPTQIESEKESPEVVTEELKKTGLPVVALVLVVLVVVGVLIYHRKN